jgi:hypothetical protein
MKCNCQSLYSALSSALFVSWRDCVHNFCITERLAERWPQPFRTLPHGTFTRTVTKKKTDPRPLLQGSSCGGESNTALPSQAGAF